MKPLQVTVAGATSGVANEVIASLPVSFAHASGPDAQVIVIENESDWAQRALDAVAAGSAGIVVIDPGIADIRAIDALSRVSLPVLLSESWAGNPVVLEIAHRWRDTIAGAGAIECAAVGFADDRGVMSSLLRQLRLLRRLGITIGRSGALTDTGSAYSAVAETDRGAQLILFGVRTSAGDDSMNVDAYTSEESVHLQMDSAGTARPAVARRVTPDGGELLPSIYEGAHRATFRRLHELLTQRGNLNEASGFADDLRFAGALVANRK